MTDDIYGYRKRIKRTSMYWGILIGLNTAVKYLESVKEMPDTLEVFTQMAVDLRDAAEADYAKSKEEEHNYAVEKGFIEDAEQQGQGETV